LATLLTTPVTAHDAHSEPHQRPERRGGKGKEFASLYVAMARADPAAFGGELSRTEGLYFTVTVLSTVEFGDITPKTDPARVITMIQMLLDLVLQAALAKLIVGAASQRSAQVRSSNAHEGQ
jgi:hypothetical protein